ncbi:DUF2057 family protein [Vibrio porteresiae]|uniref:DUF2057 family protein n=1 Tax=Vibrio porteresiae DSM 19223 TaxID=1123496 RepID=A0ABZ0QJK3_9VIBR|nr:DUF2057 family protein [Vibrio porteresiae]WPC76191.1 DUF2057 family protein [Vibrio porteresiae DSM 19223]
MSILRYLIYTTILMMSFQAFSQSTLEIPDGVTVFSVNGQAYEQNGFLVGSHEYIQLPDGANQIVFKYKTSVTQNSENVRVFDSDTIIAKFDTHSGYAKMIMPNYWTFSAAQEGIKNLAWKLETESGTAIPVIQDTLPNAGFKLADDYQAEILRYNQSKKVASLQQATGIANEKPLEKIVTQKHALNDSVEPSEMQDTVASMLNYWYGKADEKTRREFYNSIKPRSLD